MSIAPAPMHVPHYLSPRELADRLGVHIATIWRMRRRGEMPEPVRVSPGRVAWSEDVIVEWLEGRG